MFCCPISALTSEMTGQELAAYWYGTSKRYNFFKPPELLHTNVNAGHFTQMVWVKTKYFGIGKAVSSIGKIFIVAYYYPAGNVAGEFHENVLLPPMDDETNEQIALLTALRYTAGLKIAEREAAAAAAVAAAMATSGDPNDEDEEENDDWTSM